jgi:hypothetical protein
VHDIGLRKLMRLLLLTIKTYNIIFANTSLLSVERSQMDKIISQTSLGPVAFVAGAIFTTVR